MVSALPNEALQHADAVLIGEAEGQWQKLICDFKHNTLMPIYKNLEYAELSTSPMSRADLLHKGVRYVNFLQTTRGCPYNCDFCTVTAIFGKNVRTRPIESVMDEIKHMRRGFLFIVDDNIMARPSYAKKLFLALKAVGRIWISQASVNTILKNGDLVKLAAESGCKLLLIGFETISSESLRSVHKMHNRVEEYKEVIEELHDYGINVAGSFMFGFDNEDSSVFERTLEFIKEAEIDVANFSLLTPFPGTKLFQRWTEQQKIITYDWSKYDGIHAVFKHERLSVEVLESGLNWIYKEFYSSSDILRRLVRERKFPSLLLLINLSYHMVSIEGINEARYGKIGE